MASAKQLPKISFLIPIPPGGEYQLSLDSIRRQDYPAAKIEIVVCVGRHRSVQRNEGLNRCSGDFIFFLDNDVIIPDEKYVRKHLAMYAADPRIATIGGPSLTPASDTRLQRAFGQIFQSSFATAGIRARYMSIGERRDSNERELILCNQSMRTSAVRKAGGFNTNFHSGNEENELINRLAADGNRLIYDPDIPVYRSQRSSLRQFSNQIAKYGKSRVEHFLIKPHAFEMIFLAPLAFALYLLSLPLAMLLPVAPLWKWLYAAPLALYSALAFWSAGAALGRCQSAAVTLLTLLLYPVHHLSYALGMVYGLLRYGIFRGIYHEPERYRVDVRVFNPRNADARPL
ncbi:MAG: glycosyltransferase [Leptospirales bacterium]|nr:glycosyltransferase [Leptospirales bacterium]